MAAVNAQGEPAQLINEGRDPAAHLLQGEAVAEGHHSHRAQGHVDAGIAEAVEDATGLFQKKGDSTQQQAAQAAPCPVLFQIFQHLRAEQADGCCGEGPYLHNSAQRVFYLRLEGLKQGVIHSTVLENQADGSHQQNDSIAELGLQPGEQEGKDYGEKNQIRLKPHGRIQSLIAAGEKLPDQGEGAQNFPAVQQIQYKA